MISKRIFGVIRLLWGTIVLRSFVWARLIRDNAVSISHFLPCGNNGQLPLRGRNFALTYATAWTLKVFAPINALFRAGATIKHEGETTLLVQMGEFKFIAETPQDFQIINEVIIDGCYNFQLDVPCVVLDIGMNVGMASIYFASKPEVTKVYGYEIFEPTFKQALRNFSLNQGIAGKIFPVNQGVGFPARKMELPYSYEVKGSIGIEGIEPEAAEIFQSIDTQQQIMEVELEDCAEVVKRVSRENSDYRLIIKLDCEGSEYEIIERLDQQGLLCAASLYMIEWHKRGPGPLLEILRRNGFVSLSLHPTNKIVGMIYATRYK